MCRWCSSLRAERLDERLSIQSSSLEKTLPVTNSPFSGEVGIFLFSMPRTKTKTDVSDSLTLVLTHLAHWGCDKLDMPYTTS